LAQLRYQPLYRPYIHNYNHKNNTILHFYLHERSQDEKTTSDRSDRSTKGITIGTHKLPVGAGKKT
jgi:hypothetical protein